MKKLKVVMTTKHDPYSPIEFTMDEERAANYARSLLSKIDRLNEGDFGAKTTPFEAVEIFLMHHLRGHNGYYHIPYENDDYPTHYIKCDDIVFVEFLLEESKDCCDRDFCIDCESDMKDK